MHNNIDKRIIDEAFYIIENKATVRKTAEIFSVSKSTVHKDVTTTLQNYDKNLYFEVKQVLTENFKLKHIRGGIATKNKYKNDLSSKGRKRKV